MFRKLPIDFDVSGARAYLLSEDCHYWDEFNQRRTFENSPHSQMVDIWARFGDVSSGDFSILGKPHTSVWYPSAEAIPQIKDISTNLCKVVCGTQLGGVLITKLPPCGIIKPHVDSGWHAEYYEKFYVAIKSPPNSYFCFENDRIAANDGDCYWFRNDVLHWVENNSDEDRIAMIVCIKTDMFKVFHD